MDDWEGLRTALVIVVWVTVGAGALLGTMWAAFGGVRALGPDDALPQTIVADDDPDATLSPHRPGEVRRGGRELTTFGVAQVIAHATLGILTASLVTYGASVDDDRTGGYIALIVAVVITAMPGSRMFFTWMTGRRPNRAGRGGVRRDRRVEDRLPSPFVYFHGLGALSTLAITVLLLISD